jgi:hypothetical protein
MQRIIIEIDVNEHLQGVINVKTKGTKPTNYIERDIAAYFAPGINRTISAVVKRARANGTKCTQKGTPKQ